MRIPAGEHLNPHEAEALARSRRPLPLRHTARLQNEFQIVLNGHMRPERQVLKDETDAAFVRRHEAAAWTRHLSAGEPDLTAIGYIEAGDQA